VIQKIVEAVRGYRESHAKHHLLIVSPTPKSPPEPSNAVALG
jgi:hypothetical protein